MHQISLLGIVIIFAGIIGTVIMLGFMLAGIYHTLRCLLSKKKNIADTGVTSNRIEPEPNGEVKVELVAERDLTSITIDSGEVVVGNSILLNVDELSKVDLRKDARKRLTKTRKKLKSIKRGKPSKELVELISKITKYKDPKKKPIKSSSKTTKTKKITKVKES